jgi:hypothetical protein
MKNITKMSLLLFTTFAATGMDHFQNEFNKIMGSSYAHNDYKGHFNGIIRLKEDATVGFGNNDSIAALNNARIPTQQNWPLVPVDVYIPNPKRNPHDKQTFMEWTEYTPTMIVEDINTIVDQQINGIHNKVAALLNEYTLTTEREDMFKQRLETKSKHINSAAQRKIRRLRFPPLLPVHYLYSSSNIEINNLFNCCNVNLMFNQQSELDALLNTFYKRPALFTFIKQNIENKMSIICKLDALPTDPDASVMVIRHAIIDRLQNRILEKICKKACKTKQDLENKNLIKKTNLLSENLDQPAGLVGHNLAFYTDNLYSVGENGCLDIRPLILEHNLKRKRPLDFIQARETGIKRLKLG